MISQFKKNLMALYLLQGTNYLIPLITVPYVVRVLGPHNFGVLMFATSFIQYFIVLTDYGFNLTATQAVSVHRTDPDKLGQIFSSVMLAKALLMLVGLLLMIALSPAIAPLRQQFVLYLILYLTVVGNVLFPVWMFQGLEQMGFISGINIVVRLLVMVGTFALIHKPDDYVLLAMLQAGGSALGGVLALLLLPKVAPSLTIRMPSAGSVLAVFKDGWHVFVSMSSISLYTTSNTFILGLIAGPKAVGYFSAADKIFRAMQGIMSPVSQAVFPHIATLAAQGKEGALRALRRLLRLQGVGTFVISAGLLIFAPQIVHTLFGTDYDETVRLVEWMSFLPFAIGLSNVFGIQTMLNFGMKRSFSRILLVSGLLNIAIIIPLIYAMGGEGAAISVLVTEVVVTLTMAWTLHRWGLLAGLLLARTE